MPVDFLSAGMIALSWGATYLVHSTCLLTGVWILLRLVRAASDSLRETLWKIALVGGVVTASTQMLLAPRAHFGEINFAFEGARAESATGMPANSDLHPVSLAAGNRSSNISSRAENDELQISAVPAEIGDAVLLLSDSSAFEPRTVTGEAGAAGRDASPADSREMPAWSVAGGETMPRISAVIILAIAVGMAFVAIGLGIARYVWQTWSLRRKLAECVAIDGGPARRLLDELRLQVPRRPEVQLLSTPSDPEPAAFGIRRWTIVLPERAIHELSEDELRALLAHELAHLVRGDARWLCASRIICSCLAFQPLNHLARREWQRAAEYLCDEWAVSRTGTPLALARCLTEVAGWRLSGRPSAALLAATGRKSGLADRVERLLAADMFKTWNERLGRRRMLFAGTIIVGLVAICAPRVQLAVAAPARVQQADSAATRQTRDGLEVVEDPNVASNVADAAKPQADGENRFRDAEPSPATMIDAQEHVTNGEFSARPTDVKALLESLDRDLNGLESELHELEPLLLKENASSSVTRLAGRLRLEIVQLKQRREALRMHWKKSAD